MAKPKANIKEFAEKVERVLDFIIVQYEEEHGNYESPDLKILHDLKNEAANIHMGSVEIGISLDGLAEDIGSI